MNGCRKAYLQIKSKFNRTSMFIKMLSSFLLILLLSSISTMLFYSYAQKVLTNEMLSSGRDTMTLLTTYLDEKTNEVDNICNQLNASPRFLQLAFQDQQRQAIDAYDLYSLHVEMSSIRRAYLDDFFVFYPNNDRIVSAYNAICDSAIYYQAYFSSKTSLDEYWNILENVKFRHSIHAINTQDGKKKISIATKLPLNGNTSQRNTTVVCIINMMDYLQTMQELPSKKGTMILFDENNIQLLTTQMGLKHITLDYYQGQDGFFSFFSEQTKYMMYVRPLPSINAKCAIVFNYNDFTQPLQGYSHMALILMSIFSALGVAFSFVVSRSNYHSFSQIVNTLSAEGDQLFNRKKQNEIEYIRSRIEHILTQNKNPNRLKEMLTIYELESNPELYQKLDFSACSEPTHFVCSIFKNCAYLNDIVQSRQECQKLIISLLEENSNQFSMNYVQMEADDLVLFVGFNEMNSYTKLTDCLKDVQFQMRKQFCIQYSVAVSDEVSQYTFLPGCLIQAQQLLSYSIVYGNGFFVEQMKINKDCVINIRYRREIVEGLTLLFSKKVQNAKSFIDQCTDAFFNCNPITPKSAEFFMNDFLIILEKSAQEHGIKIDYQLLLQAKTLPDYQKCVEKLICHQTEQLSNDAEFLANSIEKYLLEHYTEASLYLNTVADQFILTPAYLSKLYKAQKKESIVNYLLRIRMERAATLLASTTLTVEEIAKKVGIPSTSTFIKAFKRTFNETPGIYRKKNASIEKVDVIEDCEHTSF